MVQQCLNEGLDYMRQKITTLQPWALFNTNTRHYSRNRHGHKNTLYWLTYCRKEVRTVSWNAGSFQPLDFLGRSSGDENIQNDADRDITCALSRCPKEKAVASAVVNFICAAVWWFAMSPGSAAIFVGLPGLIQPEKEKLKLKSQESLSSCNGYIKEGSLNVLSLQGTLEKHTEPSLILVVIPLLVK